MPFSDHLLDAIAITFASGTSILCYYCYKNSKNSISTLKATSEFQINSNVISEVLKGGSDGVLACISGVVQASDIPIKIPSRPDITGVVWKHTIKEKLIKQVMGFWTNEERTVDSSTTEVPFYISKNGIGILVSNPEKLDQVDLKIVSEKFEVASGSLISQLWSWMEGWKTTGVQQTEEMLVEGTKVVGIGQITAKDGSLILERSSLLPYIVTTKSKEDIIEDWESQLPIFKLALVVTTSITVYLTYRLARKWYISWRKTKKRIAEQSRLEAARAQRQMQHSDIPENLMCVVCFGLRDVLLQPCQHICICGDCALQLDPRVCPVCRTQVEYVQPIFYS